MRAVLQRVSHASVRVDGQVVGSIEHGLLALVGVAPTDQQPQVDWMARKIANLRIFEDSEGRMNRSVLDTGGGVLAISQFTLYGDVRKGRRPSFVGAAQPEHAEPLYRSLLSSLQGQGIPTVQAGVFGASMEVSLCNDGPVTLILDTP